MTLVSPLIRSVRPKQWIKNLIIYAGWLYSFGIRPFNLQQEIYLFGRATYTFIAFCFLSGAVYLFNDMIDVEADRQHPDKRDRPVATGAISLPMAGFVSIIMFAVGTALAFLLDTSVGIVAILYFMLFLAYSLLLKRVIILDSMVIATGFVLRVIAGAFAVDVRVSVWLIVCTVFLALFLGFAKRRSELVTLGQDAGAHRGILAHYNLQLLDLLLGICSTLAVISYSLYTISPRTIIHFGTDILLTLPFVFFGVFRYLYLVVQQNRGGDPAAVLLSDPQLLATVLIWIAVSALLLFAKPGLLSNVLVQ